jgi:hypothetical protein
MRSMRQRSGDSRTWRRRMIGCNHITGYVAHRSTEMASTHDSVEYQEQQRNAKWLPNEAVFETKFAEYLYKHFNHFTTPTVKLSDTGINHTLSVKVRATTNLSPGERIDIGP